MNFQPLKDFLDYYLPLIGVPGSDTSIYRNHEEIFRYRSGFDNISMRTPVRGDAIYNIYSCTKVATAVAATQLIERGEIQAQDPLYAYIPEFKNLSVKIKDSSGKVIGVKPAEKPILISHLLTMSSGISYDLSMPSILKVVEKTAGAAPTQDVCRAIAETPLEFEPGSEYLYSLSLDVMGAVIEVVTGLKLRDYMKENIFDPLGMKDTSFHYDPVKLSRMASHYQYVYATGKAKEISVTDVPYRFGSEFDSGGAGLVSTVDDYVLLADALACGGVGKSGERILSRFGVDLMRANTFDAHKLAKFSTGFSAGYGYGYGVRVCLDPHPHGNVAPKGEFGWDGAKLCYMTSSPETGISVFHAEHMGGVHALVIPRLRNLIYSCIGE